MATVEQSTTFAAPGEAASPVRCKARYDNFVGGEWLAPVDGEYRENLTPATGKPICEVAHSGAQDIELALDAAHAAKDAWGEASTTERSRVLNAVADAIEENLEMLAVAESWENGKPVRETLAASGMSAARRAGSRRSTRTPSPTTSPSRSAWSVRSSRSTFRC